MPELDSWNPSLSRRSALTYTASLVALAACGSADGGSDTASRSTPSSAAPSTADESEGAAPSSESPGEAGGTLAVTSVDFDYELESTDLAAGEYEIELTNGGRASHDLRVERDGEDVAMTEVIGPGETATLTVTLEPGDYIFYCSVANHRAMGMEVPVTVT